MSTTEPGRVEGERGANSVTRVLSMQSRISNVLALALMCLLGVGSLAWYYTHALMRQDRERQSAAAAAASRAQGELPLPSLGRIEPPRETALPPHLAPLDEAPLGGARTLAEIPLAPAAPNAAAAPKTPEQLAVERQLSGAVFVARSSAAATAASDPAPGMPPDGAPRDPMPRAADSREPGELTGLLRPAVSAAGRARLLPAQRLLLPKGAFIDCTLETAIDSTLPGMTTCVMATDAFGVDGNVVLLERGTKLIGETRGQVQQGAARIFVVWTEARTPAGVIVPLDSPGTDELGRSGLTGQVNRHFWQRFGAAMLVSVIDGAVQAAAQSAHGGSGNIVLNPSSSQDVLTEILKNTIGVPPTVTKRNGDRIEVLVARDVDFRSVYELRSANARR